MTADNRLTQCERAGSVVSFVNPTPSERDALAIHFRALRALGHTMTADEVFGNDGPVEIRVHHYLSCVHEKCRIK